MIRLLDEKYPITPRKNLKNELIVATKKEGPRQRMKDRLTWILEEMGLLDLKDRFSVTTPS